MVFSDFSTCSAYMQAILKYCFSNQSGFWVNPIFHQADYPHTLFFWKRCFHISKQTFWEKINILHIQPSLEKMKRDTILFNSFQSFNLHYF